MKMKPDAILQEIWQIKDAAAARYAGDVHKMAAELRRQQAASGRNVVRLPARPAKVAMKR